MRSEEDYLMVCIVDVGGEYFTLTYNGHSALKKDIFQRRSHRNGCNESVVSHKAEKRAGLELADLQSTVYAGHAMTPRQLHSQDKMEGSSPR
jgi:hypothetical protein